MTDPSPATPPVLQALIDHAAAERARVIRASSLFDLLEVTHRVDEMRWLPQLWHMSWYFTRALAVRYLHCGEGFEETFARHARDEVMHPFELRAWLAEHAAIDRPESVPMTDETRTLLDLVRRVARNGNAYEHVLILSLVSEGVALDFYTAACTALRRIGVPDGKYWRQHANVDAEHMQVGIPKLGDWCEKHPSRTQILATGGHDAIRVTIAHYRAMLDSWERLASIAP